jgi:hypothetical protein
MISLSEGEPTVDLLLGITPASTLGDVEESESLFDEKHHEGGYHVDRPFPQ